MRVAVVVAAMLFCMPVFAQGVKLPSVTNSIGMELIEIPLGKSSESQQMLSNFLDEPWTKYETTIATAEKSVVSTFTEEFIKQFDAAAALGDLDLAESIEAEQKEFKTNGTLPTGKSFESIVLAIKKNHENANTQLKEVYSNAISDLTKQKRFAEARIVRDEMQLVFRDSKLLRPIRKKGYFRMGEGEGVAVTLTKPFSLGKTEVTQGQWKSVMGTDPWVKGGVQIGGDCPATHVSWDDAADFCKKLTEIERKSGKLKANEEYRLPTEAEWECACRAGTTTVYSFGDDPKQLDQYGWFDGYAKNVGLGFTHEVGKKNPNPWGLYDMHGSVWEWCSDWYGEKLSGGTDPVGPGGGSNRVNRGGSWWDHPALCRSADRIRPPSHAGDSLGFRVASSQLETVTVTRPGMEKTEPVKKVFKGAIVTNSIGMELIEIPIGESIGSQQMLSNFLDEPWTKYETAIATAEKSVVSTLTEEFVKQFEAAAALGDLNLAESIEAQQKTFEKNGTLPTGKSFESTLQAIKKTGEDANTQLKEVYSNAISDLTKQKSLAEARIVKDEMLLVFHDAKLLRPIRKKGYFWMGGGAGVTVTLTKPFWLGKTEVTQGQFKKVMGTDPWDGQDYVQADKDCPATYVNWGDATEFCKKLTEVEHKAGKLKADEEYRLPTEAQWEYACRAGTTTTYSFGDDESQLGEYAWFDGNAKNVGEQYAHKVGLKKPNPWGLHDMHGNVYEWCSDWYEEKLSGGGDPVGPNAGSYRVLRGGYWCSSASFCRSASRNYVYDPSYRFRLSGFRIVRVLL